MGFHILKFNLLVYSCRFLGRHPFIILVFVASPERAEHVDFIQTLNSEAEVHTSKAFRELEGGKVVNTSTTLRKMSESLLVRINARVQLL